MAADPVTGALRSTRPTRRALRSPRTPDPTLHLALLFPHAGALTSPDDEHVPYFTNTTRRAPEVVIRTAHEMARCKKQLELTKRTGDLHNAQDDRRRSHTRVTSGADNHMLMLPHQPKEDSHLPPAKKVPAYPCPHIRILEQHGKRLRRRLSTARSAHNPPDAPRAVHRGAARCDCAAPHRARCSGDGGRRASRSPDSGGRLLRASAPAVPRSRRPCRRVSAGWGRVV